MDEEESKWDGPYVNSPELPKDPWANTYHYLYPGQHGEFDVYTYGADGQPGGEGINADLGNWTID